MAIRWEQIQNLSVTETEINLLAGLTAKAAELNVLDGFTGTTSDLNAIIGIGGNLAAHEALTFPVAHPIVGNTLDGLVIVDNTISEVKLSFDVATQVELDILQLEVTNLASDTAVQQGQIDNLYAIVIPGQGSDLADSIAQTIAHIENPTDAHDSDAISYGNNYALPSDIVASTTTSLIVGSTLIKHFRVGETIRFQDDITVIEDVVLSAVDYNTYTVTFPVTTNGYTTANNAIIWVLSEDNVKDGLDRSLRNNTDNFTGRLTIDQNNANHALVLSQLGAGDELHFTSGIIGSDAGYDLEIEDATTFSINNDTAGERFLVDDSGDGYLTQLLLREEGTVFHGTLTKETLTADRTWTFRDQDMIIGNPSMTGNALKYLRVNALETDTEWIIISSAEVTYNNATSGLAASDAQSALDEIDSNLDGHIGDPVGAHTATAISYINTTSGLAAIEMQAAADEIQNNLAVHQTDTSIHFTESSIDHLNLLNIGVNSHAIVDSHIADLTLHRTISDAGITTTDLWSASKIIAELALKSNTSHTHNIDSLTDVDTTTSAPSPGQHLEWDGSNWSPAASGEINTASNLTGDEGVFATKVGSDLQFKSLTAGSNIFLSSDGNTITITTSGGLGEVNTASNQGAGEGLFIQKTGVDLEFKTLVAGPNVTLTSAADTITIDSIGGSSGGGGTAITKNQIAHGFSVLEPIYHNGTSWLKAQANDVETLAEYVVTEVTDVDNFIANKFGEVTVTAHGKTVGEHYFLSELVAGFTQVTEPSNFSSPVFYVEDANTIHIEVYRPSDISSSPDNLVTYIGTQNVGGDWPDGTWRILDVSGKLTMQKKVASVWTLFADFGE